MPLFYLSFSLEDELPLNGISITSFIKVSAKLHVKNDGKNLSFKEKTCVHGKYREIYAKERMITDFIYLMKVKE